MIYETQYQSLKKKFDEAQYKKRKTSVIVFSILTIISIGLSLGLYVAIQNDGGFEIQGGAITYFLIWSIFYVLFIICAYAFSKYVYEKPFVEIVYSALIDQINVDEGQTYTYASYEKNNKTQINHFYETGLFPRCGAFVKYHISGFTKDQNPFDLYDVRLVQSNGQSTTVHFDGLLRVVKVAHDTNIQIRTQGKPHVKGVKYFKIDKHDELSVFKPEGQTMREVDQNLLDLFKQIYDPNTMKHMYLSVNQQQLALAIRYKKHPLVKPKKFDMSIVNQYLDKIQKEIELTDLCK